MNVIDWLNGNFSNRSKALSLYKRGMAKAKKLDHQGAIDDYTTSIGMSGIQGYEKARVLYNRALVLVATGENGKGTDDLNAVLAMDEAGVNVTTMARQKLARMETRSEKSKI